MPDPIILGVEDADAEQLANCHDRLAITAYQNCLLGRAAWEQQEVDRELAQAKGGEITGNLKYRMGLIQGLKIAAAIPDAIAEKLERRIKK